ncbi:hypothetical protein Ancab_028006 [Ancistrocladus abbreviatus]
MSDLCMYELEDIAWDEFDESDDHIVPHPVAKQLDGCSVEIHNRKRTRSEVTGVASDIAPKNVSQRKEASCPTLKVKRETMLEKDSWSHLYDGAFPASCGGDSNKRALGSASDDSRTLSHCLESSHVDPIGSELCADDPILVDHGVATDNNLYCYPLTHVTPTKNDHNLFNNDHQDKENGDLLYYGWSEMENFEDVDRMFRSCDSTFGLGIDNEDELGWFSSSHAIEGANTELTSDFSSSVLSSLTECHEACKLDNAGAFSDGSENIAQRSWRYGLQELDADCTRLADESEMISEVDDGGQIGVQESWKKHRKQLEGKRKNHYLENNDCSVHVDNVEQLRDLGHPFGKSEYHSGVSLDTQQKQQPMHLSGMQTRAPFTTTNCSHPSKQNLASQTVSGNISEDSSYPSTSQKESSYASNQMQSLERSRDVSFRTPALARNKKKGPCHHHELPSHPEHPDFIVQTVCCDPAAFQKQVCNFEGETEGNSEANGSGTSTQAELDSSNLQEGSCMSSVLDEISLEASSFRQLQHFMEQFDTRTKLCIRDSLYRLARSAEQRHKCANLTNGSRNDKDATGALTSDETNKSTGFMDMETDTNPIDRSIAHLLFHRPSDPSSVSALSVSPFKSHVEVHTSSNSQPLKVDIAVSRGDNGPDNVASVAADNEPS